MSSYCNVCYPYSMQFSKVRILSSELRNPLIYRKYYEKGYRWIRRYNEINFNNILRYPSTGCWVEIFRVHNLNCVELNSKCGRKLINKLCYF
jgi:hypothetical protein